LAVGFGRIRENRLADTMRANFVPAKRFSSFRSKLDKSITWSPVVGQISANLASFASLARILLFSTCRRSVGGLFGHIHEI
jgi:hypothetical protein